MDLMGSSMSSFYNARGRRATRPSGCPGEKVVVFATGVDRLGQAWIGLDRLGQARYSVSGLETEKFFDFLIF
jgi:hypothetical protein